jgi:hypothetical protein
MDPTMPDEVRRWMLDCYDVAAEVGLRPKWHPDADGFDYLCPRCKALGTEHYASMRMQKMREEIMFLDDDDTTRGPAA